MPDQARGYESVTVPVSKVDFNPWNPNRQTAETFRKVKASLTAYGMVELPQVRRRPGGRYEVINGEHRVRAAAELGWQQVPVFDLGEVPDQVAKKLTILTNELRGAPDAEAMSQLVRDLSRQEGLEQLADELPMTLPDLEALTRLTDVVDWGEVERSLPEVPPDEAVTQPLGQAGRPDRDSWCTPRWITEAIGEWDLDPCGNARSHVRAARTLLLADRGEDGLALAPELVTPALRVFVNPPYSDVGPWVDAYGAARFCFLLKFDPSTRWFARLIDRTGLVLFPRGTRVEFEPPPGVPPEQAQANPFPHALFYADPADATQRVRDLCFAWQVRP